MGFQNLKFATGAGLSLLMLASLVTPAFSESAVEMAGNHRTHTEVTQRTITGTIKSIVGEVVTLNLEQGKAEKIETIRISQQMLKSMGLVPGMRIAAVVRGETVLVDEVRVLPQVTVVRTETTRVQTTTKPTDNGSQQRSVATPPTRTRTEQVEIHRQQEVRETQQQRVVPPTPRQSDSVEIRRQTEVRETPVVKPIPAPPVRGLW